MGLAMASAFALGTWLVYRRESRNSPRFGVLLPLLRVLVVALIILMLTGPTLRHRSQVGEPGRIIIFVDGSQSMAMTDSHMAIGRKMLIARSRGWLSQGSVNTSLYDIAESLRSARLNVEEAIAGRDKLDLAGLTQQFHGELQQIHERINQLDLAALPLTSSVATGAILREYWLDLPGETLGDLTAHPRFQGPPTGTHSPDLFEAPTDLGDQYATRFRGYLHPPVDGNYTFWISSAGPSELWLSSSEDATAKKRIALVSAATARRQWKGGESESQAIPLRGGRRYYIEAIHKTGVGSDHLSVGWQLPIGAVERPIPGRRLSPFAAISGQTPAEQRESLLEAFELELIAPLQSLITRSEDSDAERLQKTADLAALASIAGRWESTLKSTFDSLARNLAASGESAIAAAMAKVDEASRWSRISAMLLGEDGLIRSLAEKHQIEIYAMKQGQAELLWSAGNSAKVPIAFDEEPTAPGTDLSAGLRDRVSVVKQSVEIAPGAKVEDEARTSVIIFSDGQHNVDGSDPRAMASLLAERRVPIYTVGLGSLTRPEDISLRSIEGPQSVFYEDRVQGELVIDDDMPAGKPFTVRIELGDHVIWQQNLVTERTNIRRIPFDFAIKELVDEQLKSQKQDVTLLNVPLPFKASVSPIEGEIEKGNNEAQMTIHAVTEPRRILIIDGRPRWETRYLRNLFERDQRWQVNTVVAGTSSSALAWRRGEERGAFPRDLQTLYKYDVILFGDVPPGMLTQVELEQLRDFVGERGGGLIFVDGQRGHLRSYSQTPIAELLPVDWLGSLHVEAGLRPTRLKLTASGQSATPLRLLSDPLENAALWQELQSPHWLAPIRPLAGSQVLVEGVYGERTLPAVVQRNYGAGKVIYTGFDETWRWRYEVADVYHAKIWNQLARHVGEQPYAVQDQFVKLDAGSPTYRPGERAEIRARLRDREGKPMFSAKIEAQLMRDGRKVATIPLEAGDNRSGSFRGLTGSLEPGQYEVALAVQGMNDSDLRARAKFTVEAPLSIERRAVIMDEDLLKQMAQRATGRYYREEDIAKLIARLEPTSRGRIIVTETALWRSYWWFVPIMLLLTTEWLLRKRAGML